MKQESYNEWPTPVSLAGLPTGFPDAVTYYGQLWVIHVHSETLKPMVWGHSGSDGTYAWVWPQYDLMVLYFTQSRGTPTGLELEAEIDRIHHRLTPRVAYASDNNTLCERGNTLRACEQKSD
jgi:CubicO group peptidase (beta-lactamase class C family)